MIFNKGKNVTDVRLGRKVIQTIYRGAVVIYNAACSCFSKEYWDGDKYWDGDDYWF